MRGDALFLRPAGRNIVPALFPLKNRPLYGINEPGSPREHHASSTQASHRSTTAPSPSPARRAASPERASPSAAAASAGGAPRRRPGAHPRRAADAPLRDGRADLRGALSGRRRDHHPVGIDPRSEDSSRTNLEVARLPSPLTIISISTTGPHVPPAFFRSGAGLIVADRHGARNLTPVGLRKPSAAHGAKGRCSCASRPRRRRTVLPRSGGPGLHAGDWLKSTIAAAGRRTFLARIAISTPIRSTEGPGPEWLPVRARSISMTRQSAAHDRCEESVAARGIQGERAGPGDLEFDARQAERRA